MLWRSAIRLISTMRPRSTTKLKTANGRPPGAQTSPGAPAMVAGCAAAARPAKIFATASPPRTSRVNGGAPTLARATLAATAAASARSTTPGSSTAMSAEKSPSRDAARKASTTSRCLARSASGDAGAPRTRRRPRLASCRAAAGDRPTTGAMASKERSNMSCSTKATRSAGGSVSSTMSMATPTESAISLSCSASPAGNSSTSAPSGSSRRDFLERSMSRQIRATTVVSHAVRFSTPAPSARMRRSQAS